MRQVGLSKVASRFAGSALDLVFPMSCVVCHKDGAVLHDHCVDELPRLASPNCRSCADPHQSPVCEWCFTTPPTYESLRAPYLMDGPVRELVHGLKYRNMKAWAPRIAELMADYLSRLSVDAEVLVPVPLHPKRIRERGFNQSELLAKEMGKRLGHPVEAGLLARTKDTPAQISTSTQEERRDNIKEAFACTGDVAGRRLLLVDDVVTTGSTMAACAAPLKSAGAEAVWGIAFARQA